MTEITIKPFGRQRTGIVLAGIILAVLYFAKYGPKLASIHDEHDRRQDEQRRREFVLRHSGQDAVKLRRAFKEGDAIQQFFKNLPKKTKKADGGQMALADEGKVFFDSLRGDFDVTAPLRWSFLLENVSEKDVEPLIAESRRLGFDDAEPMIDEEREGRYMLCLSELRVHTVESFSTRIAAVEEFAEKKGLSLADYTAGLVDDGM